MRKYEDLTEVELVKLTDIDLDDYIGMDQDDMRDTRERLAKRLLKEEVEDAARPPMNMVMPKKVS